MKRRQAKKMTIGNKRKHVYKPKQQWISYDLKHREHDRLRLKWFGADYREK